METALSPFVHSFSAIHSRVPSYFQTLHEGFEELQIDDVIFHDENINRGDGSIQKARRKVGLGVGNSLGFLCSFPWARGSDAGRSRDVVNQGLAFGRNLRTWKWRRCGYSGGESIKAVWLSVRKGSSSIRLWVPTMSN